MKKIIYCMAAALMLVIFTNNLFGAGQKEKEMAVEKISITYWQFPQILNVPGFEGESEEYGDWEKFLAEQFMKENPSIEVKSEVLPGQGGVDKIKVSIAGGSPPDLLRDYMGRTIQAVPQPLLRRSGIVK